MISESLRVPFLVLCTSAIAGLVPSTAVAAAPKTPAGLTVVPRYATAKVSWQAVPRANPPVKQYVVTAQRTVKSLLPLTARVITVTCTTPNAATTQCYPALSNGNAWTIRVRALNTKGGYSGYSSIKSVTPTAAVNCSGIYPYGNISGCDLRTRDLSGNGGEGGTYNPVNNLTGIVAVETDFTYATLTRINFTNADLSGAILDSATLRNTNFRGADLSGASLFNAWVSGTDFSGADLTDANFHNDQVGSFTAMFDDRTIFSNTTCINDQNSNERDPPLCYLGFFHT